MPNWVRNKLKFSGKSDDIESLLNRVRSVSDDGSENLFDFERIIPMPATLHITAGTTTEYGVAVLLFRESGDASKLLPALSYPWVKAEGITTPEALADYLVKKGTANLIEGKKALENEKLYGVTDWYEWSCKHWGTKWNSSDAFSDSPKEMTFDTAWSSPFPVIEKLSKMFPKVKITLRFADEDFGQNCGEIVFKAGNTIKENIPEGGSAEAFSLAGDVQGMGLDDYIDHYGDADDAEWATTIIIALMSKFDHKEIVETAIDYESISTTFLEALKVGLLIMQDYELCAQVDKKIKELGED
jgi:hypothetical protein